MTTAREVNEYMPVRMVELVKKGLEDAAELAPAKVAIMARIPARFR